MNTGQIISGAGHLGLIGWALFGGLFSSEPLPMETTDVSMISGEEFAALLTVEQSPDAVAIIETPELPQIDEAVPDLSSTADDTPDLSQPDTTQETPPDDAPDVSEITPPDVADVSDEAPQLLPPNEDVAIMVPEISERPRERPANRVAPTPVAPSEPDVRIDDVAQPEVAPDETAETPQDVTEETAQEAANTRIVTEADELDPPSRSLRPKSRPTRRPEPAEEPQETQTTENTDSVNDALQEALATNTSPPSGPPMTRGEKDAMRLAIQQCWNVGALSSEALRTTVVVAVSMTTDAKPVLSSIKQLSASGGTGAATKQAYEAARRAIIICGKTGYDLPRDKYDRWRNIEITF
ncbi:TolA protein, partial [hydrothermal vent metagenome]